MKKQLFIGFFFSFLLGFSQSYKELSPQAEISIITSGAGEVLYEKFGHTAIRIKDDSLSLDQIYNYGIFDFSGANFYLNFTKGIMTYKLAGYPFYYSLRNAKEQHRWVKEQLLNITLQEKNSIFKFLQENATPSKARYLYDPFFNNCATKPRDIINNVLGDTIIWGNDFYSDISLRELMNAQIHQNTWGSVGINLALGSKLDKKATPQEYLYLPDYVFTALASSKIKRNGVEENLVKQTKILLNFKEKPQKSDVVSPFLVFLILLIIGSFITFKDFKNKRQTKWLDFVLFLLTGVAGILIVFLWFFTIHSTAPNNFNILWAFPLNLIIAFYMLRKNKPKWIKNYVLVLLVILVFAIPFIWICKIQLFNWSLLPLLFLLAIRYSFLNYCIILK